MPRKLSVIFIILRLIASGILSIQCQEDVLFWLYIWTDVLFYLWCQRQWILPDLRRVWRQDVTLNVSVSLNFAFQSMLWIYTTWHVIICHELTVLSASLFYLVIWCFTSFTLSVPIVTQVELIWIINDNRFIFFVKRPFHSSTSMPLVPENTNKCYRSTAFLKVRRGKLVTQSNTWHWKS